LLAPVRALAQGPAGAVAPPPPGFEVPAADTLARPGDGTPGADEAAPPVVELRVGVIRVSGNAHTDSARIVRTFEVPPGSRYSDEAVRRGLRKLFALGLFADLDVDKIPNGDRMDLVIRVTERPRIGRVSFAGNKKKSGEDLQKKIQVHAGEVYSPVAVQTAVDSLLKEYRDDGYGRATVTPHTDTTSTGGVDLRFDVNEGEKVRITRIEFSGANAFAAKRLRKALKTKTKGLFGGGEIKDEEAAEDQERLEGFYRDHGYRDMRLVSRELKPGDRPRHLTLVMTVDEGRPYRVGDVSWSGNHVLSAAELAPLWKRKTATERYDGSKIEKVQGAAYGEYAEKGYLYVNIEPRETVRDSDLVDLAYQVTEGQPSHIRYINIHGNRATREKVIRRELDFHEGDRFRRSALMRSQGDLMRLGLFEEATPDFAAAESTDVDINIKVKEKQVGTASAGAGYTGTTGLTGFLELGHNNVLGNGQSLQLHLERGSRRSDYSLSFTEPWFHDTPTLLGISGYNMSTELDLYTEKRRGGSVRIGRPLHWPDYSRGSIGYSLEDVTITQYGTSGDLSTQDSLVLAGLAIGKPVRTSSVNLSFNRNSTDNAYYPTRGTRLSIDTELAGGPFLGGNSYIKSRVEGRVYLPSLLRHVTTMVRARVGTLSGWTGQHRSVPSYERFRLGGGSTMDPLRGYEDYMVVPDQFIRSVAYGYTTTYDTTYAGGDTTITSTKTPTGFTKVRYPGGRFMTLYSIEQQFPIVSPLHGVLFFDAGATWDQWREIQPFRLKKSLGIGFRMEIPMLGNIGFDWGYGFDRDDGPRGQGHFLLGNVSF
jgi:outer membrane protein insertion porin family